MKYTVYVKVCGELFPVLESTSHYEAMREAKSLSSDGTKVIVKCEDR